MQLVSAASLTTVSPQAAARSSSFAISRAGCSIRWRRTVNAFGASSSRCAPRHAHPVSGSIRTAGRSWCRVGRRALSPTPQYPLKNPRVSPGLALADRLRPVTHGEREHTLRLHGDAAAAPRLRRPFQHDGSTGTAHDRPGGAPLVRDLHRLHLPVGIAAVLRPIPAAGARTRRPAELRSMTWPICCRPLPGFGSECPHGEIFHLLWYMTPEPGSEKSSK